MQGETHTVRLILLTIIVIGALALFFQLITHRSIPTSSSTNSNIKTTYAFSTNICINGCRAHQNWISFYLVSNTYVKKSLRLKTSLFWGQILTYGISSDPCRDQIKPGYTCVNMEISHNLLSLLTRLNLTPLDQLQNTSNWWLEYAVSS